MKHAFVAASLLACAMPMMAGKRIVINTRLEGVSQRMETLLDAGRLRMNLGTMGSFLFLTDQARPRLVMIDAAGTEYSELDAATMAEMVNFLQKTMDAAFGQLPPAMREEIMREMRASTQRNLNAGLPQFVEGEERTIKGIRCRVLVVMKEDKKEQETCMADAAALGIRPEDAQVLGEMETFSKSLFASLEKLPIGIDSLTGMMDSFPTSRGFAIQIVTYTGTDKVEDLVELVEDANFNDADFSVGAARKRDLLPSTLSPLQPL